MLVTALRQKNASPSRTRRAARTIGGVAYELRLTDVQRRAGLARLAQRVVGGGHASLVDLRAYADAKRGARGSRALRAALQQPHVRSRPETRLLRFLRRHGIEPEMNHKIGRLHVDAYLPDLHLAIELDPEQTHGTARAEQDDAWREAYLAARGIATLRVDEGDLAVLIAEIERRRARD